MGSNVYYRFGNQGPRYGFDWHGGEGGVWPGARAAESRALGSLSGTTIGGKSTIQGSSVHGNTLAKDTLGALLWESQAPMTKQYPPMFSAARKKRPKGSTYKLPALSDWPSMLPAGPEPLDPSGLGQSEKEELVKAMASPLRLASLAVTSYHGYRRTQSAMWTVLWGLFGQTMPIVAIPVALAQGFGKKKTKKRKKNPARRRKVSRRRRCK